MENKAMKLLAGGRIRSFSLLLADVVTLSLSLFVVFGATSSAAQNMK